jgi:hypothetical protein
MSELIEQEWDGLKVDVPNLKRDETRKTGKRGGTYNCIAWSIGVTDQWIDPAKDVTLFEEFCKFEFIASLPLVCPPR